jgi:hypothetical protein
MAGPYYSDAEDQTRRELDVRAEEPVSHQDPWRPVFVVAECKNNSRPWLVLTEDIELPPGYGSKLLIQRGVKDEELQTAVRPALGFQLNVVIAGDRGHPRIDPRLGDAVSTGTRHRCCARQANRCRTNCEQSCWESDLHDVRLVPQVSVAFALAPTRDTWRHAARTPASFPRVHR